MNLTVWRHTDHVLCSWASVFLSISASSVSLLPQQTWVRQQNSFLYAPLLPFPCKFLPFTRIIELTHCNRTSSCPQPNFKAEIMILISTLLSLTDITFILAGFWKNGEGTAMYQILTTSYNQASDYITDISLNLYNNHANKQVPRYRWGNRFRLVKWFTQGYSAKTQHSQDSKPGLICIHFCFHYFTCTALRTGTVCIYPRLSIWWARYCMRPWAAKNEYLHVQKVQLGNHLQPL